MAENSKIEWTDHTFNPWIGCTKVSPGCAHCYAENETPARVARARGKELWGKGQPRQRTSTQNWRKVFAWNRAAAATGRRQKVFCASLADWLDDEVPLEWLADLLQLIHDTPHLDWLLLTKRPQNWRTRLAEAAGISPSLTWVRDWIGPGNYPENVWIGTTVEDQARAEERIPELLKIPAKIRFLSVEPQLGRIDLSLFGGVPTSISPESATPLPRLHWVINGLESGHKKRAGDLAWMRDLRDQCQSAGVAYFCKQIDKIQAIPQDLLIRETPLPRP